MSYPNLDKFDFPKNHPFNREHEWMRKIAIGIWIGILLWLIFS